MRSFGACPACNSVASHPAVASRPAAEMQDFAALRRHWRGFFKASCFFSYSRCASCSLLYCPRYFDDAELAQLYAAMPDNMHEGDSAHAAATQALYLQSAQPYLSDIKKYAEVGPDIGLFLQAVRGGHQLENAQLAEPNRAVWPQLQRSAGAVPTTLHASWEELAAHMPAGACDLLAAIHVLDHLPGPREFLCALQPKLRRTGRLLLVVHNEQSWLAKILGARWPAYCLQHPQIYNPRSIRALLQNCGYRVLAVQPAANIFALGYVLEHAIFAIFRLRLRLPWLRWTVQLRLGNMLIIAEPA